MKRALTIAGSDSGGGAGIQADLKTFMAFGVHGMSAITALTAQNTMGVQGIFEVSPEFVRKQIESVMTDIGTDAAKTGMLSNAEIVRTVAEAIRTFRIPNLVVDPVMVAKSGDSLLAEDARQAIRDELLPLATVITPNVFEAEALLDRRIEDLDAMRSAARELKKFGCRWVVIKGGSLEIDSQAVDVVCGGEEADPPDLPPDGIQEHQRHRLHVRLRHRGGARQGALPAGCHQARQGIRHRGDPKRPSDRKRPRSRQPPGGRA